MKKSRSATAPVSVPRATRPQPSVVRPDLHDHYGQIKRLSAARVLRAALQRYVEVGPLRSGDADLCHSLAASLRQQLDPARIPVPQPG